MYVYVYGIPIYTNIYYYNFVRESSFSLLLGISDPKPT